MLSFGSAVSDDTSRDSETKFSTIEAQKSGTAGKQRWQHSTFFISHCQSEDEPVMISKVEGAGVSKLSASPSSIVSVVSVLQITKSAALNFEPRFDLCHVPYVRLSFGFCDSIV